MIEQGVVRSVTGAVAEVEIRPESPEACTTCGSCEAGPEAKILRIEAVPGIAPGRRVVLDVPEPGDLGPALVVFLLPVLALVIGAALGALVPAWTGWRFLSSAGFGLVGAILLLVPVAVLIRAYDRRITRRAERPRIVRITG